MQALEQFLARDLRREGAQRRVRDLVLRIEPGAFGHRRPPAIRADAVEPVARQRRDHEGLVEGEPLVELGAAPAALGVSTVSILFRIKELAAARSFGQAREDGLDLVVKPLAGVDQQRDDVRIPGPAPGRRHHGAVEPALRARRCRACRRR